MALNMAAEISKPPKRLSDLLQERQEPFVLEVYLSERGCLKKNSLKRSATLSKSTRGIARYAKVLQMVRKMLVSINGRLNVKNSDKTESKFTDGDKSSSTSSTTVYNSCSESDPEDAITYSLQKDDSLTLVIKDALNSLSISGEEERREFMEDSKNLSPVSVLEKTTPSRLRHKQHENLTKTSTSGGGRRVNEDLILSASLRNLHVQSSAEEAKDQCLKSKTRKKQLLFDFVKKMIVTQENTKRTKQQQQQKQVLGSEELGKFIGEKIKACGKESSVTKQTNSDVFSSKRDIGDYEQMKGEIGIEIADAILKEMCHEIVIDMFDIY